MILTRRHNIGQAATELAIFGAIIIFVLGVIIRTAVSSGQGQDAHLKAMRYALLQAYKSSMEQGTSRNTASILYLEDKITPDFNKYGSTERSPYMMQVSGTMTNMLLFPLDEEDLRPPSTKHIPVMDVYINGKHFTFTTAAFTVNKPLTVPDNPDGRRFYKGWDFQCGPAPCPLFYQIVVNLGTTANDYGVLDAQAAWDLNRDDDPGNDPTGARRSGMAWHWKAVQGIESNVGQNKPIFIDAKDSNYPVFDVDNDRQEEVLYNYYADVDGVISAVTVLDYQDGDLDPSSDDAGGTHAGLQSDMAIYTKPAFGSPKGNYLLIQQGKVWGLDGKFVRSVNRKDQVDLVERKIQLSNDTGRMCNGSVPDVEVCGDCFSVNNIARTCFDRAGKILYVRSRLLDKLGHFWKTDASGQLRL
ncbi:MAG: hypothetical protein HYZ86_01340 [Candidatus Omnitrophica bacterium]|nr:hypothetical protein [Candidatus Omnitrophota bacterium]